jgi:hypothetical protein
MNFKIVVIINIYLMLYLMKIKTQLYNVYYNLLTIVHYLLKTIYLNFYKMISVCKIYFTINS